MLKKILLFLLIAAVGGCGLVYYMWNMPHKKVESVSATSVVADTIIKEFATDEKKANGKYLNKVIEVSGTVSEIDTSQDGGIMAVLQTADPMAGIQCAMRDKSISVVKGQNITVKGFCSGYGMTGVSLTGGIIEK